MSALICLSGGLDSATLLGSLIGKHKNIVGIFFDYSQNNNTYEQKAVYDIANYYNIKLKYINELQDIFTKHYISNFISGQGKIPKGHYSDYKMKDNTVPARNMLFISILTGIAISEKCKNIYLGIQGSGTTIYPDCTPSFIYYIKKIVDIVSEGKVKLNTPFENMSKADIINEGIKLNVPYHLTRSCYEDQLNACGACGACSKRIEGFKLNGLKDSIKYE